KCPDVSSSCRDERSHRRLGASSRRGLANAPARLFVGETPRPLQSLEHRAAADDLAAVGPRRVPAAFDQHAVDAVGKRGLAADDDDVTGLERVRGVTLPPQMYD